MAYVNRPKRSHSLAHHRSKLPTPSTPSPQPTLTRSSSLSTRSTALPKLTRSLSLPQKPVKPNVVVITPPTRTSSLQKECYLEWKYRSAFDQVDWGNLFSEFNKLWQDDQDIFEFEDTVREEEAKRIAEMIWNQDESVIKRKDVASYLGKDVPSHHKVLVCYMNYFNFKAMRLDVAFRKLCSKLFFKAEAQEIDRILKVFAYKYWTENDDPLYMNADTVYAITYSMMLLNTDLYVIQSNQHTKMTCESFCNNVISTLSEFADIQGREMALRQHLADIYTSIRQRGILQPKLSKSILRRIHSSSKKHS